MATLTASTTPEDLSDASYLVRLPEETWLDILSSLNYFELHALRTVCKRMETWVKDPALDTVLFRRGPPPSPPKEGVQAELHPALQRCDLLSPPTITTDAPARRALDYLLADEFATSPATTRLLIDAG